MTNADCEKLGDCSDARIRRLYEYLDGVLSHEDIAEVQAHLDDCPECSAEHDIECIIRSVVRRTCQQDRAPETLKASILTRITEIRVTAQH